MSIWKYEIVWDNGLRQSQHKTLAGAKKMLKIWKRIRPDVNFKIKEIE